MSFDLFDGLLSLDRCRGRRLWSCCLAQELLLHLLLKELLIKFELALLVDVIVLESLKWLEIGHKLVEIGRRILLAESHRSWHQTPVHWYLLHGHLDAHSLLELELLLLQHEHPGLLGLCNHVSFDMYVVVVPIVFKTSVLGAIPHHEQIILQFLLLGRVQLSVFVVTILFLPVLLVVFIFIAEAGGVFLSIAEVLLTWEVLVSRADHHLLVLDGHHLSFRLG